MPHITISPPQQAEETHVFYNTFGIFEEQPGVLSWFADHQTVSRGGTYQIWVQSAASDPTIVFVLPEWQLIIDDQVYESAFYQHIAIGGRIIELRYMGYTFRIFC